MKARISLAAAVAACCCFSGFAQDDACPLNPNIRGHENTEWSTSYAYHLTDAKKGLPRVLLVGDSILNGYVGGVIKRLEGKINVTYWISSYCVSSPGYLKLLEFYLAEAKYDVIHFNNGLHSVDHTPLASYKKSYEAALRLIRAKQPEAKLVVVTSTPFTDPARTEKVRTFNAAILPLAKKYGATVNDLFALDDPFDRKENWADTVHHKPALREREAEAVASVVNRVNEK